MTQPAGTTETLPTSQTLPTSETLPTSQTLPTTEAQSAADRGDAWLAGFASTEPATEADGLTTPVYGLATVHHTS